MEYYLGYYVTGRDGEMSSTQVALVKAENPEAAKEKLEARIKEKIQQLNDALPKASGWFGRSPKQYKFFYANILETVK